MVRIRLPLAVLVVLVVVGLLGIPVASATPPGESGVVERGEIPWFWWEFDEGSGLAALFNLDLGELCLPENEPDPFFEGLPPGFGFLGSQVAYVPSLADTSDPFSGDPLPFPSFVEKLKGEMVPTMVWALNEDFFTEFLPAFDALPPPPEGDHAFWEAMCGWWVDYDPLAWGYTKVRANDNDLAADVSDNNRSNAYGFTANGTLMDDDGKRHPFHTVVKVVWSGDIFVDKFHGVFKIGLR